MISKQIIKLAKTLIAAGQAKKLFKYLIKDHLHYIEGDLNMEPDENTKLEFKNKIQQIQKKSFNFTWFVNRFIAENKHYEDIDPLLNVQQAYKKLNKELRTFEFKDDDTFADFNQFMDKYLNKNVKNQNFQSPSYCKLIHSDSKYNYYYADANDKKCYQDLHKCNTKKDGKNYAMWCVVCGTVEWGRYTTSQFPFYIYVTNKNNLPVMLFNFGYDRDAQIKDIHNGAFTKYDEQLLNSIKQIANKYNFDIAKNNSDFKTFNKTDELYSKQFDIDNIAPSIISESNKYNGLNFIVQNIVYDFKKNQKAYFIINHKIVNLKGYKLTLPLLTLIKDKQYNDVLVRLLKIEDMQSYPKQIADFFINYSLQNNVDDFLYFLLTNYMVKDKQKTNQIILHLQNRNSFYYLSQLIADKFIIDQNLIDQIVQSMANNKGQQDMLYLIKRNIITDKNLINETIEKLIQDEKWNFLTQTIFYQFTDQNKKNHIVNKMLNAGFYDNSYFYMYIKQGYIKDETIISKIISAMIEHQDDLKELLSEVQLSSNNRHKIIQYITQNTSDSITLQMIDDLDQDEMYYVVESLIKKKNLDMAVKLVNRNKITDEQQIQQIIQQCTNNKQFDLLTDLIINDQILDEQLIQQIIKECIDNNRIDNIISFIVNQEITDQNIINNTIKTLVDNDKLDDLILLLESNCINDFNVIKKIINDLFKNHITLFEIESILFYHNTNCIDEIIQFLIDEKQFEFLKFVVEHPEDSSTNNMQKIKDALNKNNIKISSIANKLFKISKLLR